MYRILSASKDSYITNKYIANSRSFDGNVGQAGTLDLFKLYNETALATNTGSGVELSRLLVQFDYSKIQALTSSVLDYSSASFQAYVELVDVYGGQIVPSNYTVELLPLSKSWDEGRGHDVISYRDVDACNWVTASLSPIVTWSQAGAGASGSLGDDVDVIISGNLGSGLVGFGVRQTFDRGDENLSMNVTALVSASLAGIVPNNGFRLSFITAEEDDTTTRFVKRFGTRHAFNKGLRPRLVVKYDDTISDPGSRPFLDMSSSLFVYNALRGTHRNFFSGSNEISGANSLIMELVASKSLRITANIWSPSHSQSINHVTRSVLFYSRSYSGSNVTFGTLSQTGIYSAPFHLSTVEDSELRTFVSNSNDISFNVFWKSIDRTVIYARNSVKFQQIRGHAENVMETNMVVNITNLKDSYTANETQRLRVFVSDYNQEVPGFKVPTELKSVIIPNMQWRILKAFSREVVIPWSEATRMSTDADGMYFDFYFSDLDINEVYEFELLCKSDISRDTTVTNNGFRFKVTK